MPTYLVKQSSELSEPDIQTILAYWEIDAWKHLSADAFREEFKASEFHLLTDSVDRLLAVARINFEFTLQIDGKTYAFAELVGLAAGEKGRGYGKTLVRALTDQLRRRHLETLGFCQKALRPFYEGCGIPLLYDQAKFIREPAGETWVVSDDDDILDVSLSPRIRAVLEGLNAANLGYFAGS